MPPVEAMRGLLVAELLRHGFNPAQSHELAGQVHNEDLVAGVPVPGGRARSRG
jgi:hypothetical protein